MPIPSASGSRRRLPRCRSRRDFDALLAVLDPDVVLRADAGAKELLGAQTVAKQAVFFSRLVESVQPVLVNGVAGIVSWQADPQPFSVMAFTVRQERIVEIEVISDPARLRQLNLERLAS